MDQSVEAVDDGSSGGVSQTVPVPQNIPVPVSNAPAAPVHQMAPIYYQQVA